MSDHACSKRCVLCNSTERDGRIYRNGNRGLVCSVCAPWWWTAVADLYDEQIQSAPSPEDVALEIEHGLLGNCADVCLSMDWGDDYNDFFSQKVVSARKPWRCCECDTKIQPGQRYERCSGKMDGQIWTEASCLSCVEIRKAFVCGGYIFGQLWDCIREELFPIWETSGPLDCLAKIESLETRNRLRDEYRRWRASSN